MNGVPEGDGDRLVCGAAYDDLVAQVADRRAPESPAAHPHLAGCVHCAAALAELQTLWAPVHDLAREPVRAPADVLTSVMARVRELPRQSWYAVVPGERGETRIAARVVAAVARLAAEEVPAVMLALGRGRTGAGMTAEQVAGRPGRPATEVGVAGTHVVVDVQVAVALGSRLESVADRVRTQIARRVAEHTGLTTQAVNVVVADVTDPR